MERHRRMLCGKPILSHIPRHHRSDGQNYKTKTIAKNRNLDVNLDGVVNLSYEPFSTVLWFELTVDAQVASQVKQNFMITLPKNQLMIFYI